MDNMNQQFASDNYAGICPEALNAMLKANDSHIVAYGDDEWTARVSDRFRELFEADCEVFFVFNGTAANSLALASLCQSYHSIICHPLAHIETDECGAPEFFSHGSKILTARGEHGKLNPEAIDEIVNRRDDIHYPKPKAVSVTQTTELATVYTPDELHTIHQTASRHGLHIHMDGARFANAVAALGCRPRDITTDVGIDVLCFGGTKNGLAVGEAVIFFNKALAEDFDYRCKQAGQLASKMRYLAAPWLGLLDNDVWLKNAAHANAMARKLESLIADLPGIDIAHPVQANALFVNMPQPVIDAMHAKGWHFYTFIGTGQCRLMCAWDTEETTVEAFAKDLKETTSL